jgi:hypothetical protein
VTGHGGRARSRTAGPPKSSCGGCRTRPRWARGLAASCGNGCTSGSRTSGSSPRPSSGPG